MTQCSSAKVKLSNSRVDKLKSVIKCATGITLTLLPNMICVDKTCCYHKLILTDR